MHYFDSFSYNGRLLFFEVQSYAIKLIMYDAGLIKLYNMVYDMKINGYFCMYMANGFFRFRQFTVWQDACAMKVGTDGTLLGAWAEGGVRILDVGTGTGLIAMMMAQRFPQADVTGIDLEKGACEQALSNVRQSVFHDRVSIFHTPLQSFDTDRYDAIVCNPPFFVDSLGCPDESRNVARHASTLTYSELFYGVSRLLADTGVFSAIVPFDCYERFGHAAVHAGMFLSRVCAVRTTPRKSPRRYLLAFRKHPCDVETCEECLCDTDGTRSQWYGKLTENFYL